MARDEEKAMAPLNRWIAQKRDFERASGPGVRGTYMGGALLGSPEYGPTSKVKRPKIASEVDTVKECEIWRTDIIRGVSKKIAEIQNASLGEHRLRDLNDEINKDLREKGYWEDQIKALGGPDYKAQASKVTEVYGAELASHSGYKYFGAAKDLPGVREIFEAEVVPEAPRKTRKQLFKNIQPDYFGWRDEEDGMLLLAEQRAEHEAVQKEVARWQAAHAGQAPAREAPAALAQERAGDPATPSREARKEAPAEAPGQGDFKAYVDVPTLREIEELIIKKKKQALLAKYATHSLRQEASESNQLIAGAPAAPG